MNYWNRRHDYYENGFCPKCAESSTWSEGTDASNLRLSCLCGWKETDEDLRLKKEYWSNKEVSNTGHHKERKVASEERPVAPVVPLSVDTTVEDILSETAKTFKRFGVRDANKYLS